MADKLKRYEAAQLPRLARHYPSPMVDEIRTFYQNFKTKKNHLSVFLKRPGQNTFVAWYDPAGFIRRPEGHDRTKIRPESFFVYNTQHLDHFELTGDRGQPVTLASSKQPSDETAVYQYQSGNVRIERTETIGEDNQLREGFVFHNPGDTPTTLRLVVGSSAKDLYETRFNPSTEKAGRPVIRRQHQLEFLSDPDKASDTPDGITGVRLRTDSQATVPPKNASVRGNVIGTSIRLENSDGVETDIAADPAAPDNRAILSLTLPPGKSRVDIALTPLNAQKPYPIKPFPEEEWQKHLTNVTIDAAASKNHLPATFDVGLNDVKQVLIPVPCGKNTFYVPAAGYPNFGQVFGRDSLITARMMLPYQPWVANQVLQMLAHHQGKEHNPFTEEAPGKIMHELSAGELARLNVIPHQPYYGTEDATPLFVMLLADYVKRTNDRALLKKLWPNLIAALGWMEAQTQGKENPVKGYLPQRIGRFPRNMDIVGALLQGHAKNDEFVGLRNTTWMDHARAFGFDRDEDRKLKTPESPVYPAELQGYLYAAWQSAAELFALAGKDESAQKLSAKADVLKRQFNRDYWQGQPDEQYVAVALDGKGKAMKAFASNGLHALWSGIVSDSNADAMLANLDRHRMLSGWGVRTLSPKHPAYDPVTGYHTGCVWGHETAIITDGIRKSDHPALARSVGDQLLDSARLLPSNRMPEVLTGLDREPHDKTVGVYPDTCVIQAWSAASPYQVLTANLGLEIDAARKTVIFNQPMLPGGMKQVRLENLMVTPGASVDLAIRQLPGGRIEVIQTGGSKDVALRVRE